MLFPVSLVGSYPQPDWLIDRARLAGRFPPRVRATELWRVDPAHLEEAQKDATLLAIRAQERAGLDIVTATRCPVSPGRSGGGARWRWTTSGSCGPAPTGPSR
jgi:methionine synthase II (cobalamin-independent)